MNEFFAQIVAQPGEGIKEETTFLFAYLRDFHGQVSRLGRHALFSRLAQHFHGVRVE